MNRKLLKALILLGSLFSLEGQAAQAKKYIVAFPKQNFYPQYEVSERIQRGLLVDIIEKFSKDQNIEFVLKSYPIKRYVQLSKEGKVDFIFPDNPEWISKDSKNKITFSKSVTTSTGIFFSNSFKRKDEVKTIATIRGYTIPFFQKEISHKEIKKYEIDTGRSLVNFISKGRAQVGYFHEDIINKQIKENSVSNIVFAHHLPKKEYSYHLSSIHHKSIIQKFNNWLSKNREWIKHRKSYLDNKLSLKKQKF